MPRSSRPAALARLGVVGYSTRALAAAAVELGFSVVAIDAFADQDCLDIAQCEIVECWPTGIIDCARRFQCDGWLLAGGMEHQQRTLTQLASQAPVLGPSRSQLAQLRSTRYWRQLASQVPGLQMPQSSRVASELHGRDCLYKPRRSSGGHYVADATTILNVGQLPRGYWQQLVLGRSLGITTLLTETDIMLCGATESFSAADWPGPKPYIYRGSIGPIELSCAQRKTALDMAARVREQVGLTGWLQADFIEDGNGELWLLEINPRWTAGMEVLHACAPSLADSPLAGHLAALGLASTACGASTSPPLTMAKAILYAPCKLRLSRKRRLDLQQFRRWHSTGVPGSWDIADVPAIGGEEELLVDEGQPLLTLRMLTGCEGRSWGQLRQDMLLRLNQARLHVLQQFSECD